MNKALELLELKTRIGALVSWEKIEVTDFLRWKIAKLEAWRGSQEVFVVSMLLEFTEKYCCLLLLLSFGNRLSPKHEERVQKCLISPSFQCFVLSMCIMLQKTQQLSFWTAYTDFQGRFTLKLM